MIQCEVCGKQLPDDAAFCPKCGTIVKSRLEAEKEAKKRNKTKYVVMGVAATVFAFAAGLIVWNLFLASRIYDQRIEIAKEYSRDKDYDKSLVAYALASYQNPEKEEAYIGMCNVYLMQNEDAKAAAILQIGETNMDDSSQIQDKKQELSSMNGSEIFDEQAAVPEYTQAKDQDIPRDKEQAKEKIADLTDEILYGTSGWNNEKSLLFDDNIIYAENAQICQMDQNGNYKKKIAELPLETGNSGKADEITKIVSDGVTVFALTERSQSEIYAVDVESKSYDKLMDVPETTNNIWFYHNKVYYQYENSAGTVMVGTMKKDGTGKNERLAITGVQAVSVTRDYIYYVKDNGTGVLKLWREDLENQKTSEMFQFPSSAEEINKAEIIGNQCFYESEENGNSVISCYDMDTKENKMITYGELQNLYDGDVYYSKGNEDSGFTFYKIAQSGKDRVELGTAHGKRIGMDLLKDRMLFREYFEEYDSNQENMAYGDLLFLLNLEKKTENQKVINSSESNFKNELNQRLQEITDDGGFQQT